MPESVSLNWMEIIKVGITDYKENSKMKISVNKTDFLFLLELYLTLVAKFWHWCGSKCTERK